MVAVVARDVIWCTSGRCQQYIGYMYLYVLSQYIHLLVLFDVSGCIAVDRNGEAIEAHPVIADWSISAAGTSSTAAFLPARSGLNDRL
jgi:hypothetical protein